MAILRKVPGFKSLTDKVVRASPFCKRSDLLSFPAYNNTEPESFVEASAMNDTSNTHTSLRGAKKVKKTHYLLTRRKCLKMLFINERIKYITVMLERAMARQRITKRLILARSS